MASDPGMAPWIDAHAHYLHQAAPAAGAILVVLLGLLMARLAARRKPVDITT
jgi:hypothetical protein